MARSPKDLFDDAMVLSEAERTELVSVLHDTLDTETEEGVEAAWIAEFERRMQELDSGEVKTNPWSEARGAGAS